MRQSSPTSESAESASAAERAAAPAESSVESVAVPATERRAIRRIVALALPTFGQLVAEPAFILIDTAIVGHIGDGGTALAGLSIGSTVILTAVGLCVFLAYGTTSQVARLIGAGRRREGMEAGISGLWLALGIGIVVSIVLFAVAEPLCVALGAGGAGGGEGGVAGGAGAATAGSGTAGNAGGFGVLGASVAYLRAVVFGLPGMLLVYAANGVFRGMQRMRITLIVAVAGAALNTVLDVLFVFGLRWGVAGSGAATLIAQWFMGVALVIPALRWARAAGADWRPRLQGIAHAAGDGVPLFVRTLALRVSMVGTVMLAASMGTRVLAAYQVVNASWNFTINMLDAIAIAGQTLVAAELGAGRRLGARSMTRLCGRAGAVGGCCIGAALAAFGLLAAGLFSPDDSVRGLVVVGMLVLAVFLPLGGWMWALDGILIGAGDYRYLAVGCTVTAAIYVPALLVINALDGWLIVDDTARMVVLWTAINVLFVGVRALVNGLRVRTDEWTAPLSRQRSCL
ncbi:MATE family efflux transporter [Bifidobacterium jacchi]|uniref:MATE family efflux transporter n=1 Tax=Bifidobacterium jacchi TaxID=2490545 RepID=A0A5N5RKS4_9BIFI|nr:MATE family efflux transporter [Bifidobacterium jacchi]KAB5607925.1 MATE family efflux transporter [Bifidobacterium jacchi]